MDNLYIICKSGGLDLSKEVLRVFVDQTAAKLQTVKVGGLRNFLLLGHPCTTFVLSGIESQMKGSASRFDIPP